MKTGNKMTDLSTGPHIEGMRRTKKEERGVRMQMEICTAKSGDVDEIMEIMEESFRTTESPEWYVTDSREYVLDHTQGEGFILKAVEEGKILAFLIVHIPEPEEDELGGFLGLPWEERKRCAYMDSVSVCPRARGRGLMGMLLEEAEKRLEREGIRHLLGTVHPQNRFSRNNVLRLGYREAGQARLYGGLPRVIIHKEIGGNGSAEG